MKDWFYHMSKLTIPQGYRMPLSNNELQRAIELIHEDFQRNLTLRLNLHRVSAPLFVDGRTGLNDDLNGVERPVTFDIPDVGAEGQVVHSLAKWKRLALKRYEFPQGMGLFTDMNAIRRDEVVDNLHSIYVDQWDWEKHIGQEDRKLQYLKDTVRDIVGGLCDTASVLRNHFPALTFRPDRDVYFITTQELEKDHTYSVLALRRLDGTPLENETFDFSGYTMTPLVAGCSPAAVNNWTLSAFAQGFAKDGVYYYLLDTQSIEMFADRTVYMAFYEGFAPSNDIFTVAEDGTIAFAEDFAGVQALFTLPLDPAKADRAAADAFVESTGMDGWTNERTEPGGEWEIERHETEDGEEIFLRPEDGGTDASQ